MPDRPLNVQQALRDRATLLSRSEGLATEIEAIAARMTECLHGGGTIYACGNGGSATQAQHFAAELVGRFKMDRAALRAFSLNDNIAIMTSLANDYDFDDIFARQLAGIARSGDCLLALSTSGNSENVVRACRTARERGVFVAGLTSESGGDVASNCDLVVRVPHGDTAFIQEVHLVSIHLLCEIIEADMSSGGSAKPPPRPGDAS